MASNHYLGLTIGPILKTLQQARTTRELWASSYLLSRLMEFIVLELEKESSTKVLIPSVTANVKRMQLFGAGIYPDRLFMVADYWVSGSVPNAVINKQAVQACIDRAIENIVEETLPNVTQKSEALHFWKRFFRVRFVIKHLPTIEDGELSLKLSPYLDTKELEDTPIHAEGVDFLVEMFSKFTQIKLISPLKGKDAQGNYAGWMNGLFPATHEVAAYEIFKQRPELNELIGFNPKDDNTDNSEFYKLLEKSHRSISSLFRQRHKYFCLVQADADKMGETIKQLAHSDAYRAFSEKLADYGAKAAQIIDAFGGKPIYIGGDDLLFLCPVSVEEQTVFDLITDLDTLFPKQIVEGVEVSMSFGVNIVYYKYPLFEAILDAYFIMRRSKDYVNAVGRARDAVSFQFTKHSGSEFRCSFSKEYLNAINQLIRSTEQLEQQNQAIVSSLIYKLFKLESIFSHVAITSAESEREARFLATMDQYFNEWKKTKWFNNQRDAILTLLHASFKETGMNFNPDTNQGHAMELFYQSMRLVQFMIAPSKITQTNETENIAQTSR
jgi:CRISPR-associated protein Cmr2